MYADRFNEIITEQIKRSTNTLITKAGEYATDGDRLHNFRIAAALLGGTMEQAIAGMMVKHTVSVYDLIQKTGDDFDRIPIEMWNEKITDHINYLLLLRAVVDPDRGNGVKEGLADGGS